MEIYGVPPSDVLALAQRKNLFFENNEPILTPNSRGKVRQPKTKTLQDILMVKDKDFLNFLDRCFEWHPARRMTPLEALKHPWILEGLPETYLKYHMKIFGGQEKSNIIETMTSKKVQGFPKNKKDQSIHQIVQEIKN